MRKKTCQKALCRSLDPMQPVSGRYFGIPLRMDIIVLIIQQNAMPSRAPVPKMEGRLLPRIWSFMNFGHSKTGRFVTTSPLLMAFPRLLRSADMSNSIRLTLIRIRYWHITCRYQWFTTLFAEVTLMLVPRLLRKAGWNS